MYYKQFTHRQGLLVTLCSIIYTVSSVHRLSGRHHDLVKLKFLLGFTRVVQSLVFCVMFCRSLFVFLSFFFWPLYWLSFSDIRFLIAPLVSSNLSRIGVACIVCLSSLSSRGPGWLNELGSWIT